MHYDTTSINAIVLAGGINRIELFDGYRPGYKALLPFRGRALFAYTLDALKSTPEVDRICIVGPAEEIRRRVTNPDRYEFIPHGESLLENIFKGLFYFRECPVVLVITSDLPLVTAATITDFVARCKEVRYRYDANIFWSVVREQDFEGAYRNVRKGFNRFRDVSVCHGNLLLITPSLLQNRKFAARMERIYQARKNSVASALAVGPLAGFSYMIGVHFLKVLTLNQYARVASAGFGVGLIPVIMNDPDIAVDVDEARDYRFIMEELDRREQKFRFRASG